jgi:hypothetical protein
MNCLDCAIWDAIVKMAFEAVWTRHLV